MKPDISVVIVTYNRENFLPGAIESVLDQRFSNFELIIIDDASTDNTEEVVKKYLSDERVKYFKVTKCNSIAQVRNSAWVHTTGKYIAVLDSDDIWYDNLKLTKQYNFLEKNLDCVLVGGGAVLINDQNKELDIVIKPESDLGIRKDFFVKNPFFHSSVMYRSEIVRKIGGYSENIKYGEDLDLWLKMGEIGKLHNLPETLIKYRVHNDNESSKHFFGSIFHVFRVISKNRKQYGVNRFVFIRKIFVKFFEYFKK